MVLSSFLTRVYSSILWPPDLRTLQAVGRRTQTTEVATRAAELWRSISSSPRNRLQISMVRQSGCSPPWDRPAPCKVAASGEIHPSAVFHSRVDLASLDVSTAAVAWGSEVVDVWSRYVSTSLMKLVARL
jgi:hypothetical protein